MPKNIPGYMAAYIAFWLIGVLSFIAQVILIVLKVTEAIAITWALALIPLVPLTIAVVGVVIIFFLMLKSARDMVDY